MTMDVAIEAPDEVVDATDTALVLPAARSRTAVWPVSMHGGPCGRFPGADAEEFAPGRMEHRRRDLTPGLFVNIRPIVALEELRDNPHPVMLHTWRVLRCLHLWLAVPPDRRTGLLSAEGLSEFEAAILLSSYDHEIRLPLGVIVASMGPEDEMVDRMAWACMAAGDWAAGQNAPRVMLAFMFAAACASAAPGYRLVAELASVRHSLRMIPAGDPESQRHVLAARRAALEAEIARHGGPAATREGLTICRSAGAADAVEPSCSEEELSPVVGASFSRHLGT